MLVKTFPTRVIPATVVRVHHLNCLEVRLQLDFGITITKRVIIEGIDGHRIPPKLRPVAKKALVVLVGGKPILVHTDPAVCDGILNGRVYLNEKVHEAPASALLIPHGFDQPLLEVGFFFQWLLEREFDFTALKAVLNGRRPNGAPMERPVVSEDPGADFLADPARPVGA